MSRFAEPPGREITPEAIYLRRREFIRSAALTASPGSILASGLVLRRA